jgi:sialate O-acetylesterase
MWSSKPIAGAVAALCWAALAPAEVRVPALFGDNMVLQRDQPVPVWGWSDPGDTVTVSFAGQTRQATAGADGRWLLRLDPMPASAEPRVLSVRSARGAAHPSFTNVLVGEVWICSGQSNMKASLAGTLGAANAIAAAGLPRLRLFDARMWAAPKPLTDVVGRWAESGPESAAGFSAVGFHFGRTLLEALDIPVGLIGSSAGGTAAEAWISEPALEKDARLKRLITPAPEFYKAVEEYGRTSTQYEAAVKAWLKTYPRGPHPTPPATPFKGFGYPPASHYNAMIAPLVPFAMQGAIWYQGEARTGRYHEYAQDLSILIADWRSAWSRPFPFLIVQLPAILPRWDWPLVREAQLRVSQTVTNTGLAVTMDLGEPEDLHPKNKAPIGARLARVALGQVYRKPVVFSGPVLDSVATNGAALRLLFRHADGLAARGGVLNGFEVAGADRHFVPAQARVDGAAVIVESKDVPSPAAVRYAFEDNPAGNLFNGAGLPASPFRTDDWPWPKP